MALAPLLRARTSQWILGEGLQALLRFDEVEANLFFEVIFRFLGREPHRKYAHQVSVVAVWRRQRGGLRHKARKHAHDDRRNPCVDLAVLSVLRVFLESGRDVQ